ncbi:MAG: hypothetical protein K0R31_278 [Clostridiales bacterium]|jgi:hypothetical protein|nr:hypothetical protein [Clostridiales bacterium]
MSYYTMDIPCWLNSSRQMPSNAGVGAAQPYLPAQKSPYMMQGAQGGLPSTMPTGLPTGPQLAPMPMPSLPAAGMPGTEIQPAPQTVQSTEFVAGYLKTQIGQNVRVEFLIGTNGPLVDRTGTLVGVGASFILIRPSNTDDILLCDLYSIKFVTFYF